MLKQDCHVCAALPACSLVSGLSHMVGNSLLSSPLPCLLLQVGCEEDDLSDAEKVYAECDQQRPLLWEECITPQRMKQCVKIGEGTFGEVFSTTNASGEVVALKVCGFV